jgi:hypothetical protein
MGRSGAADPEIFVIFDLHGLSFLRGTLIRDLAALNKVELLPWDCWGLIERESLGEGRDLVLLDQLAQLTRGDVPEARTVRSIDASDARLKVRAVIPSLIEGVPVCIRMGSRKTGQETVPGGQALVFMVRLNHAVQPCPGSDQHPSRGCPGQP